MNSRTQFPKPIWLSKGLHGPIVEVDTAERAAELLETWPNGRGKWYIAASRACRAASSGNAVYHGRSHFRDKSGAREIIQKEQWARALYEDVVYTMIYDIVAKGFIATGLGCKLHFGADTIGGGDQDRIR